MGCQHGVSLDELLRMSIAEYSRGVRSSQGTTLACYFCLFFLTVSSFLGVQPFLDQLLSASGQLTHLRDLFHLVTDQIQSSAQHLGNIFDGMIHDRGVAHVYAIFDDPATCREVVSRVVFFLHAANLPIGASLAGSEFAQYPGEPSSSSVVAETVVPAAGSTSLLDVESTVPPTVETTSPVDDEELEFGAMDQEIAVAEPESEAMSGPVEAPREL